MANDFNLRHPSKAGRAKHKTSWPAWYYGPDGESRIFNAPEEVPDDWATNEQEAKRMKREREKDPETRMTRKEIIDELKARGVKYDYQKPAGELWQLLRDIREHEGPLEAEPKAVAPESVAPAVEPVSKVENPPAEKFAPMQGKPPKAG